MTATHAASTAQPFWFLDTRIAIRLSHGEGEDGISVIEHRAHHGDSPPFHLHRTEDEVFHVLEGEMRFRVGEAELRGRAGDVLLAPKGVPHTYRVESAGGARWMTVTRGGDFEAFLRAFGRPAERDGLPERSGPPTPAQVEALTAACRRHGIEVVGPPLEASPGA